MNNTNKILLGVGFAVAGVGAYFLLKKPKYSTPEISGIPPNREGSTPPIVPMTQVADTQENGGGGVGGSIATILESIGTNESQNLMVYVDRLHKAMDNIRNVSWNPLTWGNVLGYTDEEELEEIILGLDCEELNKVMALYYNRYNSMLIEDVEDDTSGDLRARLTNKLFACYSYQN